MVMATNMKTFIDTGEIWAALIIPGREDDMHYGV
jgi:hypothetical protein